MVSAYVRQHVKEHKITKMNLLKKAYTENTEAIQNMREIASDTLELPKKCECNFADEDICTIN
jgi:hypothetical protein